MWGNVLGWIIAALLAAGYVTGIVSLTGMNRTTQPTAFGWDAKNLSKVDLPTPPTNIVAADQPGDASGLYVEAIDEVLGRQPKYANFIKNGQDDQIEEFVAVPLVVEATHLQSMNLFAARPAEVISYKAKPPQLEALELAGKATIRAGLVTIATDPKKARAYYEAAYSLGAKLYAERVTFAEAQVGLGLLSEASAGLSNLPAGAITADELAAIREAGSERSELYTQRLQPVQKVITAIDEAYIARNAGDIFKFAVDNKERMWRVESILKVGRYKWNATRTADQLAVESLLTKLKEDPDPVIQTAARKAEEITLEQFKGIGN